MKDGYIIVDTTCARSTSSLETQQQCLWIIFKLIYSVWFLSFGAAIYIWSFFKMSCSIKHIFVSFFKIFAVLIISFFLAAWQLGLGLKSPHLIWIDFTFKSMVSVHKIHWSIFNLAENHLCFYPGSLAWSASSETLHGTRSCEMLLQVVKQTWQISLKPLKNQKWEQQSQCVQQQLARWYATFTFTCRCWCTGTLARQNSVDRNNKYL